LRAASSLQEGHYRAAVEQSRRALERDPKNQTALYHLIQALRKTGENQEIPLLRKEASRDQSRRYQDKLVEEDSAPK
jgi:thioredoxin-like negative regulator of GroEL